MQNSQNQENPDGNEDRQTTGFGIRKFFTAAAASLRAAGTRAQELVEGTTNAVLSSLPFSHIRVTEPGPLTAANNNVPIENQLIKNVRTLANTHSRTNLSLKGSYVIKTDLVDETVKASQNVQEPAVPASETSAVTAGQSKLPSNEFFKGSSIIKTNLQLEQAKETKKVSENLKAPAVQTPAGQTVLSNIDFFKGSFIIKTNLKNKLAEGTAKVFENLKVPPVAQTAPSQAELPYIDFFKGFSSIETNLYVKQAEETPKTTEQLKTLTSQSTADQPESKLQLQTPTEKAGTSVEPVGHVHSNLQSTGTQADEMKGPVVNSLTARRQITARKAESAIVRQVFKSRIPEYRTHEESPSFFTEHRLSNLARIVSTNSQTRRCLIDSNNKIPVVSRQPETTSDFKSDHRHTNVSQWAEIDFIHHSHSTDCESQTVIPTTTSRKVSSSCGRRILSTEPNFTSHMRREAFSKFNDITLHRRKARRLSELVEQRRLIPGTVKTILATQDSRTETAERNELQDRRSRTIPSASMPSMMPVRSENVRARGSLTKRRATRTAPNEQRKKFIKAIKQFFGQCAGFRRRH